MTEGAKHLRNAGIVVLLAVALWALPGGSTAGSAVANVLTILLLAGLAFFAYRLYMEHRTTLLDLPDDQRMILYGSVTLAVVTLIATARMWNAQGAWILVWFLLLGVAAYGLANVVRRWRSY